MSDQNQIPVDVGKIKNSASQPTTSNDVFASHLRLSKIFAPLIDFDTSGEHIADYDSTTLHSLQSTMSSSSSSNPVRNFPNLTEK